jgi:hypothetical protein
MPPSFYLGPRKPKLELTSWEEVVIAAAAGVLDETQWVELKEKVPPASKPANLELARDFSVPQPGWWATSYWHCGRVWRSGGGGRYGPERH